MNQQDERLVELQRQFDKMTETMGKLAGVRKIPTFAEFAGEYLEEKLANPTLRDTTKRSFEQQVSGHLIPTFGEMPIDKISNKEFLKWVSAKREEAETKKSGRGRLTRFFNARKYLIEVLGAAKEKGHIEKLPKLDNPDTPRSVGRVLQPREVLKILRHTGKKLFRLFFFTLWKMGCRPREVLRWEWDMLRQQNGRTWIDIPARISKTVRSRSIPINPAVARRFKKQMERGGRSSRFIFPNVKDPRKPQMSYHGAWAAACKKAKVKAMPYDLRRTFITEKAASGKPIIYVAKVLDTSSKMIESVYAKSQSDVMEAIVN